MYTFFLIKLKLFVCLSVHNNTFNGLLEDSSLYYDSGYQSIVFQTVVHHCIAEGYAPG